MKSFRENLATFEKEMGFARTDIIELSGLTDEEIETIENGVPIQDRLYAFVFNLGLDYKSIYSDRGFRQATLESQYAYYPSELRKAISRKLCRKLIKAIGSENSFRQSIRTVKDIGPQMITRILRGTSSFAPEHFKLIRAAVSPNVSESEYDKWLSTYIYCLIANYNLSKLKKHFNLSYEDLATALRCTPSNVANWGGSFGIPVPETYYKAIGKFFGGLSAEEISTKLLTLEDYKDKQCEKIFKSSVDLIIESDVKNNSSTPENSVDMKVEDKRGITLPPEINDEAKPGKEKSSKPKKSIRNIAGDSVVNNESAADNVVDKFEDLSIKLFKKLKIEDKLKVISLITELAYAGL